jgi:hypothetical protein
MVRWGDWETRRRLNGVNYYMILKNQVMSEKKVNSMESPDVNKLQAVVIDHKTTIYIALKADPVKAKERYIERANKKSILSE